MDFISANPLRADWVVGIKKQRKIVRKDLRLAKLGLSFTLLLLFTHFFGSNVWAQDGSRGLSISPPTFELSANPGDVITNVIRLDNPTENPVDIAVDKRNFTALGEQGEVSLTEEEAPFSLASWIEVSPVQGVLLPRGSKEFEYTIRVPLNAEPGGHFGSVVFITRPKADFQGSGVVVAQEVGSLVLLKVAGETEERVSIESFRSGASFFEYGPVDFEVRVKNEGNVHLKPAGSITITDFFGQKVASIPFERKNILPGAIRKLNADWDQKLLWGKYTATVSLVSGSKNQLLTTSTTFFAFPYKIGGIVIALGLMLSFFFYRGRKRLSLALKVLFGKAGK